MARIKYNINSEHAENWYKDIGKLVVNFSAIEFESHLWLVQMSEKPEEISTNAKDPFMQRVKSIRGYINLKSYDNKWKTNALSYWEKAENLAIIRNRIAHNPIFFAWNDGKEEKGEPDMIGIIDMKRTNKKIEDTRIFMDHKSTTDNINEIASIVTHLDELRNEWCNERDKISNECTS